MTTGSRQQARIYDLEPSLREVLQADRIYFVRPDGNDNNTGLGNTSGTALLTPLAAVDKISSELDTAGYVVTVQLSSGTYSSTTQIGLRNVVGWKTNADLIIQGDPSDPAAVIIIGSGVNAFSNQTVTPWRIQHLTVQTTGSSTNCLYSLAPGAVITHQNLVFGTCAGTHIIAISGGSVNKIQGTNYKITGGANFHWVAQSGGNIRDVGGTVTITGTPAFTTYASATTAGIATVNTITYSGSATGKRYDVTLNGVISSGGATLPGDSAGTTATGGQYA